MTGAIGALTPYTWALTSHSSSTRYKVRFELVSGALRLEVHDAGEGRPAARTAAADEESGRGLWLVERLSARWGSDPRTDGPGKVVWCEVVPVYQKLEKSPRRRQSKGLILEAFSATAPVTMEIEDVTIPTVFGHPSDALAAAWEALRVLPLGAVQAGAFHHFPTRPDAVVDAANALQSEGELSLTFRMDGRLHSPWVHPADVVGSWRGR